MYKVEKYLDQCVASILNQTYTNLEVILVDDGSPDNCPAMCDEWALKDSRVRVIHKPNGGLDTARNAGLDVMKGEFVGTIDSDDFIAPNMYERLYTLLIENDADISMCRVRGVNEDGSPIDDSPDTKPEHVTFSHDDLMNGFLHGWSGFPHIVVSWDKLYKAEIFETLRFAGGNHEDSGTLHRIFGNCRKLISTTERLCYYRHREDSITGKMCSGFQFQSFQSGIYHGKDHCEYFTSIGRPDIAALAPRITARSFVYAFKHLNYLQFRKELSSASSTLRKLIFSRNIGDVLRGIKLALFWLRSIFRPFLDTNPFIEKEKNT